jgi:hypothetical protein
MEAMTDFAVLSDELKASFRAHAAELAADVARIAEAAVAVISERFPKYAVEDELLAEALRVGAPHSIGAELVAMQADAALPDGCPEIDAEGARLAARSDIPLDEAVWLYRAGHKAQWDAWYRLITEREAEPAARRALHEAGSAFFFAYADRMSAWYTREYTAERDRRLLGEERRRADLVRAVLEGESVGGEALGYSFAGEHVCVLSWGGSERPVASLRNAARVVDRRLLVAQPAEGTWWSWLGGDRRWGIEDLDGLASELQESAEDAARYALGAPQTGLDGFRRTHEQAVAVRRLMQRGGGDSMGRFDQIELELLCSHDPRGAAEFIDNQLGELLAEAPRARKLRATLASYLACDGNAASAAARLGVHGQTVANRLRAVEELTGRPLTGRHADLAVALRLARYRSGA